MPAVAVDHVGEASCLEEIDGRGAGIFLRAEEGVPLEADHLDRRGGEAGVGKDLPLAALDVHLDQVDAIAELVEEVDRGDGVVASSAAVGDR